MSWHCKTRFFFYGRSRHRQGAKFVFYDTREVLLALVIVPALQVTFNRKKLIKKL